MKPTKDKICLCMIGANESHIIKRCLDSVVDYIDFWVINDNSENDEMADLVTNYFKEKGIPGILDRSPWESFVANRSLSFRIAEKESNCDWMFVIDCDDYLVTPLTVPNGGKVRNNKRGRKKKSRTFMADSFLVKILEGDNVTQMRQHIFKIGDYKWRYSSIVHECPVSYTKKKKELTIKRRDGVKIKASRDGARSGDPLKYFKDALALMNDYKRVLKQKKSLPHYEEFLLTRYPYYICQSWFDYGHYENALEWADKRINAKKADGTCGFKEEIFWSHLRKCRCMRYLKKPFADREKQIQTTVDYDPVRAESFVEFYYLYKESDPEKALKWLKKAATVKKPDRLFIVEDYTYDFGAEHQLAQYYNDLGMERKSINCCLNLLKDSVGDRRKQVLQVYNRNKRYLLENIKKKPFHKIKLRGKKVALVVYDGVDQATVDSLKWNLTDYSKLSNIYTEHDKPTEPILIHITENCTFCYKSSFVGFLEEFKKVPQKVFLNRQEYDSVSPSHIFKSKKEGSGSFVTFSGGFDVQGTFCFDRVMYVQK